MNQVSVTMKPNNNINKMSPALLKQPEDTSNVIGVRYYA